MYQARQGKGTATTGTHCVRSRLTRSAVCSHHRGGVGVRVDRDAPRPANFVQIERDIGRVQQGQRTAPCPSRSVSADDSAAPVSTRMRRQQEIPVRPALAHKQIPCLAFRVGRGQAVRLRPWSARRMTLIFIVDALRGQMIKNFRFVHLFGPYFSFFSHFNADLMALGSSLE